MKNPVLRLLCLAALPIMLVISACGSAPGNTQPDPDSEFDPPPVATLPPETPPSGPVNTVRDQLSELGVDVAALESTPRVYGGTLETHAEFTPLGMRARIAPFEIFAAGVGSTCTSPGAGETDATWVLSLPMFDGKSRMDSFECYAAEEGNLGLAHRSRPDAGYGRPGAQSTRAVAAGDFDGDGVEEGVVVYARPGAGGEWFVHSYLTDNASPFILQDSWLPGPHSLGTFAVVDVEAVAADLDGNGLDDLLVAVVLDDGTGSSDRELRLLAFLQNRKGDMAPAVTLFSHTVPAGNDELSVRLATGNHKAGPATQAAVVLRSLLENSSPTPVADVRYWVFDGLATGASHLTVLQQDTLEFTAEDGTVMPFITADLTFGDFDGDGMRNFSVGGCRLCLRS